MDNMIYHTDNPYYFNTELPGHRMPPNGPPPPHTPPANGQPKSGGAFSFFRRRSSSSSSVSCTTPATNANANRSPATIKQSPGAKAKPFNSATLGAEAAILGSRRSSLTSLFRPQPVAPAYTVPAPAPAYLSHGPASLPLVVGLSADPRGAEFGGGRQQYQHQLHQQRIGFRMQQQQQQQQQLQLRTRHESYGDSDEVFLQNGPTSLNGLQSMHYPNENGLRRHSIGAAARNGGSNERIRCGSLSDEVPKSYAPRPPVPHALSSSAPSTSSTGRQHARLNRRQTAHQLPGVGGGYCFNTNSNGNNGGGGNVGGMPTGHDDMDDILIVTSRQSEPAILWANYLKQRFDKITKQRGRKPFNFLHIKIDEEPLTTELARRCHTTKLQIVILCPLLVQLPEHFLHSQLSVCLRPDIVLGILLEVPEERVAAMHRQALPAYRRWRRCVVPAPAQLQSSHQHHHHHHHQHQQHHHQAASPQLQHQQLLHQQHQSDQQSLVMAKVLGIATDILGRALCQRPLCNTALSPTAASDRCHALASHATPAHSVHGNGGGTGAGAGGTNGGAGSEAFTVLPRKVKVGQSKVVALLGEPLGRDDVVRVLIEKHGEQLDVIGLKRRNPYTLQFSVPDACMEVSTMIEIRIVRNERELGRRPVKCESRLRELEQLLRAQDSPMAFMCQALGLAAVPTTAADGGGLDALLVQAFQRNVPAGFHLLAAPAPADGQTRPTPFATKVGEVVGGGASTAEEFPTLLHFAARWGLEQLAVQLMECPGGEQACELRNVAGRTPAEMAEGAGHAKLAASLKSFAQMNELSTMYHYFKGISAADSEDATTVQLATAVRKPSVTSAASSASAGAAIRSEEYMEMNADLSGERQSNGVDNDIDDGINAVTNLNYINIDSIKDEEIARNLNDSPGPATGKLEPSNAAGIDAVDAAAELSSELLIQEPAYYESNSCNRTAPVSAAPADAFSQDCLNVLENCNGGSRSASSLSSTSTASAPAPSAVHRQASIGSAPDNSTGDYMLHPSNIPVLPAKPASGAGATTPNAQHADFGDYLMQPSNRPVCMAAHHGMAATGPLQPTHTVGAPKSLSRQQSNVSKAEGVDAELLEIMNDFKKNVFTIQEVEQLVDAWKARNDVRQSFKDKQEQLGRMREEYERVQVAVREKMKHRPTPFERMRKLFGRGGGGNKQRDPSQQQQQQPHSDDATAAGGRGGSKATVGAGRPRSSLSLQSLSSSTSSSATSSSGRLSTGSACSGTSLGDSGTHSDPEERRGANGSATVNGNSSGNCRLGTPGSLMMTSSTSAPSASAAAAAADNYLIPPAPRPVSTSSLQTPTSPEGRYFGGSTPTLQKPTSLRLRAADCEADGCSENYTMFPSNVPVQFGSASVGSPQSPAALSATSSMVSLASPLLMSHHHDYMNFSGLNTIEEAKEAPGSTATTTAGSNVMPIKVRTPDEIYGLAGGGSQHSNSSCTINGSGSGGGGGSTTVGYKRPSLGDLCSSFKPLAATASASAAIGADAQSVRFQKGSQQQLDGCRMATESATSTRVKLCKSSSSPSVGVTASATSFSTMAHSEGAALAAGEQHDYMNV